MDLKDKKIVAIIAHPDDETLGCGGLLSKAARMGADCRVILPLKRTNERKTDSWLDEISHFDLACKQLGATTVILEELTKDELASTNIQKIALLIGDHVAWADIVLCHWKGDVHHAHQSIAKAVELATRPFRSTKTVMCFEIPTSTEQGFENTFSPNCFVFLDEIDMTNKKTAMSHYSSEIFPGRTPEDLECQMRYRGGQAGTKYAEAYTIVRYFM